MKKMKITGIKYFLLFILISFLLFSCEKKESLPGYKYFIDADKVYSYSKDQLKQIVLLLSIEYPDISVININSDVSLYKIKYKSSFNGVDITASGLVIVPELDSTLSVLLFQNGTNTCHKNAPSKNPSSLYFSLLSSMASSGYVIAISDYIGFGESEEILHPYMHRASSDKVISDMLRAVTEMAEDMDIASNIKSDYFLMGYSQGGWASLSALHYLEINPVEDMQPIAACCGAGAYNLTGMAEYILQLDEYPSPFYMPYFIESRISNGLMNDDLGKYFKEPYASEMPAMFYGDQCNGELSGNLPHKVTDLMTQNLIENFSTSSDFTSLRNELSTNSIEPWSTSAKLRFFHSSGDSNIPYEQSKSIYSGFQQIGDNVSIDLRILVNDSIDHNDAIIPWGIDAINWLYSLK